MDAELVRTFVQLTPLLCAFTMALVIIGEHIIKALKLRSWRSSLFLIFGCIAVGLLWDSGSCIRIYLIIGMSALIWLGVPIRAFFLLREIRRKTNAGEAIKPISRWYAIFLLVGSLPLISGVFGILGCLRPLLAALKPIFMS